jgi:MOSC domain-containing protein YiiM
MDSNKTGRIAYIGIRPVKNGEVDFVESAEVNTANGLVGDHYKGSSGKRQLTLILEDQLAYAIDQLQIDSIRPEQTRRNILVSGLRSEEVKAGDNWSLGNEVVIEITGPCRPCDKMNQTIGPGAKEAMENRGGFTARIIKGGEIRIDDPFEIANSPVEKVV